MDLFAGSRARRGLKKQVELFCSAVGSNNTNWFELDKLSLVALLVLRAANMANYLLDSEQEE